MGFIGKVSMKLCSMQHLYAIESLIIKLSHVFWTLVYWDQKKQVPRIENPILLKSATQLAKDIRERKLQSVDVVNAYIERIQEVQPLINAVAENRYKQAMVEAQEVDELINSGKWSVEYLAKEKPLLGVPVSIKILISVKGLRCNAGSKAFENVLSKQDAEVVTKMKLVGAIILVTTNAPEFGGNIETVNKIYGRTSNPYDLTRGTAGSSGGEGALIASGGSSLGLANDIAGSIRIPSFYNGIFGHKCGKDVISCDGMFPVLHPRASTYVSTGPMCRYAEDLTTTMKVLTNEKKHKYDDVVDFTSLKIYFMLGDCASRLWHEVDKELRDKQMEVVHYFNTKYGVQGKEVNISNMKYSLSLAPLIFFNSIDTTMGDMMTSGKMKLNIWMEMAKCLVGRSQYGFLFLVLCLLGEFPLFKWKRILIEAQKLINDIDSQFRCMLDGYNAVFLYPSGFTTALHHHEAFPAAPRIAKYTSTFNLLGLPVTQCPLGLGSNGLPLGIQIVGGRGKDHLTIAVAKELEKAFGGWVPPNSN